MSRTGLLQLLALFGALLPHSVLAQLTCPKNSTGCECEPWVFGRFILMCSSNGDTNDINYEVKFSEENEILIHCHAHANPWGNFLNGETLNITDPAEYIIIHNCPIPSVENIPVVRNNSQPNLVSNDLVFLTNLTTFFIWKSNSSSISANFLCRLPKLKRLIIKSSNITFLPTRFFNCSKNLIYVSLKSNKFTPQPGVFNGLVSILNLDLSQNNISNLHRNVFRNLRTLRTLNLSYNNISEIPSDIFKDLTGLKELNLKDNQLTYIPEDLFSSTTKLKTLDLSNNNYYFINKHHFKFLRKLEYLNMENNKLVFIFKDTFVNNEKLKIVKFAFNYLNLFISNIFCPLPSFRYNLHLEEIHLAHNHITEMHTDWRDLPNLRFLDMSDNHMNNLKFEDLQFKARTVTINLQRNQLKTVDLTTLECLKYNRTSNHTSTVKLLTSGNPFECTCDSFLRYLNVAMTTEVYNNIKLNFDFDICLNQRINCTFRNDTCINN